MTANAKLTEAGVQTTDDSFQVDVSVVRRSVETADELIEENGYEPVEAGHSRGGVNK